MLGSADNSQTLNSNENVIIILYTYELLAILKKIIIQYNENILNCIIIFIIFVYMYVCRSFSGKQRIVR